MDHLVLGQGARQGQTDHPRQVEALGNQKEHIMLRVYTQDQEKWFSVSALHTLSKCGRPFINSLTQEGVQASQLQVYNGLQQGG